MHKELKERIVFRITQAGMILTSEMGLVMTNHDISLITPNNLMSSFDERFGITNNMTGNPVLDACIDLAIIGGSFIGYQLMERKVRESFRKQYFSEVMPA